MIKQSIYIIKISFSLNINVGIKLSEDELKLAIKAARALKLPVCGVDMLQSARGPLIMEVNSTPGLEGIEGATQKNIARAIITFIERNRK